MRGERGREDGLLPIAEEEVRAELDSLVFIPDGRILYEVVRAGTGLSALDSPDVAQITITA